MVKIYLGDKGHVELCDFCGRTVEYMVSYSKLGYEQGNYQTWEVLEHSHPDFGILESVDRSAWNHQDHWHLDQEVGCYFCGFKHLNVGITEYERIFKNLIPKAGDAHYKKEGSRHATWDLNIGTFPKCPHFPKVGMKYCICNTCKKEIHMPKTEFDNAYKRILQQFQSINQGVWHAIPYPGYAMSRYGVRDALVHITGIGSDSPVFIYVMSPTGSDANFGNFSAHFNNGDAMSKSECKQYFKTEWTKKGYTEFLTFRRIDPFQEIVWV